MSDEKFVLQKACEQFLRRKKYAAKLQKIDNRGLHAGAPMYYYCKECGTPTEVLPEEHLFPPNTHCSQCYQLIQKNWIKTARDYKEE